MHFPFVDRLHVGASEAQVEEALRGALKPGVSEAKIKKLLKMSLKQHRENREMYGYVMGGMHRPKRKNPELLIVRNPGRRKMASKRRKARRVSKKQRAYKALVKKYGVSKAAKIWDKRVYGRGFKRVSAKRGRLARRRTLRMIKQMKRMAALEDQIRAIAAKHQVKPSRAYVKAAERKLREYRRLAK